MLQAPFASNPIIFTPRVDVRDLLKQELRALGAQEVVAPLSKEQCIEALILSPEALLVIDWETGAQAVSQILAAVRGHFKIEIRPIFMILPELDTNLVQTAAEFGVSHIHAGPVSRNAIRDGIQAVVRESVQTHETREMLLQVATARSKGDWSVAMLEHLHRTRHDDARITAELAENLIHEEAWDKALALVEPLCALTPPDIRALHLAGRCYMQKGDFDAAIGFLGRAKLINPLNVERLIDLGNALLGADEVEQAKTQFQEAMLLDPDSAGARTGVGKCLLMEGEVNEALGLLKATSGPRELASIFNTAAILSMRQGRHELGMRLYQSGLAAVGKESKLAARLLFNMGLGYRRWDKPDRAKACFARCMELDPNFAKAKRHLKDAAKLASKQTRTPPSAPAESTDHAEIIDEESIGQENSVDAPHVIPDDLPHDFSEDD